ncbi:MAG: sigma-70 family RNA polymerase sigma factor [Deltaproteobacteria bacterium]|nr:sigma-70 family RNA polymerase sigma factor [Deltaproteobacteria bacterium]
MSYSPSDRRTQIEQLYRTYGHVVMGRCIYLLRNDSEAQDAAQDVFVKVMNSYDRFRMESSPITWILKIATNHCLNVLAARRAPWHAKYRRHAQNVETQRLTERIAPERTSMIRAMLEKVDTETQQIAIHYYVDEMTQSEIATILNRSLPTIRKRLAKFKRVADRELSHDAS